MPLSEFPVAVLMRRYRPAHPWAEAGWRAVEILPWHDSAPAVHELDERPGQEAYLVTGLRLALHGDDNDGYFENWAAPEPRVFVMCQPNGSRTMPVLASVSYTEGTRMLDSGDRAEGLPMPPEVHAWVGAYLARHYRPTLRRGREHG